PSCGRRARPGLPRGRTPAPRRSRSPAGAVDHSGLVLEQHVLATSWRLRFELEIAADAETHRCAAGTNVTWPSPCVAAGPSAPPRTEHRRAQRTATVLAPASVAATRSPGCNRAPSSTRTLSVPWVGDPGAPRSAMYATPRRSKPGGTNPSDSTP